MTAKLFDSLRVIFGSHNRTDFNQQILCWAKTEYGNDWRFAYNQIIKTKHKPIKEIDY